MVGSAKKQSELIDEEMNKNMKDDPSDYGVDSLRCRVTNSKSVSNSSVTGGHFRTTSGLTSGQDGGNRRGDTSDLRLSASNKQTKQVATRHKKVTLIRSERNKRERQFLTFCCHLTAGHCFPLSPCGQLKGLGEQ